MKHFANILDNLVFRNYYSNSTSTDITTTWSERKTVFKEKLRSDTSLNWISNQTRYSAIEKLNTMILQINSYVKYSNLYMHDVDFMLNQRLI